MIPQKYTTDQLAALLTHGEIDPFLWMAHFPETLDTRIPSCEDCADFKIRICPGGKDPVDCFLSRT